MVCFNCRKPGHSVKDCPTNSTANPNLDTELDTVELATGICYHCGTMEHSSKNCDHINRKKHPFKFATCFLCREDGHLASKCKNNINGLYPNGGGCKHCDSKDHFAKDCEMEKKGNN
ncbi:hypothetical protein K502DRAFT_218919 [Neoconidiobolus thromboides FSU 785]|nr:hypothetical protein K502DRAFT_218919 [Neoconidiobolus thromboides FSU 785]